MGYALVEFVAIHPVIVCCTPAEYMCHMLPLTIPCLVLQCSETQVLDALGSEGRESMRGQ